MQRLIRAEVQKLFSTRAFPITAVTVAILSGVAAISNVFTAGKNGSAKLGTVDNIHHVLQSGAVTGTTMLAIGIIAMAGEYRHGTIVPSLLAGPDRRKLVIAKMLTLGAVGALFGAICFGIGLTAAVPVFASKGVHHLSGDIPQLFVGAVIVSAVYAMLGVALGALTRSTVAAVVGALVWVQLVEVLILQSVAPGVAKWLPTGAATSITRAASATSHALAPWPATALLIGYAVAIAAVAGTFVVRRDVA
jgi:ABC-2 type transport system permease protein